MSRASVATATGLTRATVSALVDDLVAGKLLTELEPSPRTGAGRPAVGLALAPDGPAGLGLEINVDYLAACVVDLTGTVRHRLVEHGDQRPAGAAAALAGIDRLPRRGPAPPPAHGPAAALAGIDRLAGRVRALADADGLTLAGAALAVPGLVAAGGVVRRAPNLGWHDVDVPAQLRDMPALGDLWVAVDNEANLAALGE